METELSKAVQHTKTHAVAQDSKVALVVTVQEVTLAAE
jgi:hypothetical protein